MLGRRPAGGDEQREMAFHFVHRGRRHTTPVSSPPLFAPPKLFLEADGTTGGVSSGEEAAALAPELAAGHVVMSGVSPTSTLLQPAEGAAASPTCHPTTSPWRSNAAAPFSRSHHRRPWEARPIVVGLAGALLNGEGTATTALLTGHLRPVEVTSGAPRLPRRRRALSPTEMDEASEGYTRVIAGGGPNPRITTHVFDDRVVTVGSGRCGDDDEEFLRWCHGCSKDLGHGKDIFMYRGEMAFCSHECRYRQMLLFHDEF